MNSSKLVLLLATSAASVALASVAKIKDYWCNDDNYDRCYRCPYYDSRSDKREWRDCCLPTATHRKTPDDYVVSVIYTGGKVYTVDPEDTAWHT